MQIVDNDTKNNTVPVEVQPVQESAGKPAMTKEELEAIKARLADYRKIDNELSSTDWIRANCQNGGDWAKHANKSLDLQYTLIKSDLDKLIAEVSRLQEKSDACAWEADNARQQLVGTGITWEEFPYGCDTLQHIATKLAGSRQRVKELEVRIKELEAMFKSPPRVFLGDLNERQFKIELSGRRLRDVLSRIQFPTDSSELAETTSAVKAWDEAVNG